MDNSISSLDGTDCLQIQSVADRGRRISRLMIARLNLVSNADTDADKDVDPTHNPDLPRVYCNRARTEADPFLDPSILDPIDETQEEEVLHAVADIITLAKNNGLDYYSTTRLTDMFQNHMDIFRVYFSAGPPAKVRP